MVLPIKKTIMYGPVNSRRLGKSMGINLMPYRKKYCDFDCLYCHYGRTRYHRMVAEKDDIFPDKQVVLEEVEKSLRSDVKYSYLTFSGNGEPTLHPEFPELAAACHRLARKIRPYVKLTLLSNSSTCGQGKFLKAFEYIDLPIMKLDAGRPELFQKINRPVEGIEFFEIVEGLSCLENITIQALFLAGNPDNSTADAVADWLACLGKIKPAEVQIYTTDRPFARSSKGRRATIHRVEDSRMAEIVRLGRAEYKLNIRRY